MVSIPPKGYRFVARVATANDRKLSTGWITARVEFYIDGKNTFNEDYFDIKPNVKFDPAVLDPQKFNETCLSVYLDK
jgi:hypothetical protein